MRIITQQMDVEFGSPVLAGIIRKAAAAVARLITQTLDAFAEARVQRAAIEAELYLGRYRHTSKNDDDLPILRFPSIR